MMDMPIKSLPLGGATPGFRPFAPPFCSTVDVCTAYRTYLLLTETGADTDGANAFSPPETASQP